MPFFPSLPFSSGARLDRLAALSAPFQKAPHEPNLVPLMAGLTLLLVEDSRFAAEAIRIFCQRVGARLRRVETLSAAKIHLRTYRPDVVIIDSGLPDGCGDELISSISQRFDRPLILGTSADTLAERSAIAAGADAFLAKPLCGFDSLVDALRPVLSGQTGHRQTDIPSTPSVDCLALQDDLKHAADHMIGVTDHRQRLYWIKFLAGISDAAADRQLLQAAFSGACEDLEWSRLVALVQQRVSVGRVV